VATVHAFGGDGGGALVAAFHAAVYAALKPALYAALGPALYAAHEPALEAALEPALRPAFRPAPPPAPAPHRRVNPWIDNARSPSQSRTCDRAGASCPLWLVAHPHARGTASQPFLAALLDPQACATCASLREGGAHIISKWGTA